MRTLALLLKSELGGTGAPPAKFGISEGCDFEAAAAIATLVDAGREIWLNNDLDEGNEGITAIRRGEDGYVIKIGGHGWQGSWEPIGEATLRELVMTLAPLNRGTHWSNEGTIRWAL